MLYVFLPVGIKLILILSGVLSNVSVVKKRKKELILFFIAALAVVLKKNAPNTSKPT